MYVCMYIYIYIYIYVCMHIYVCIYIYIYILLFAFASTAVRSMSGRCTYIWTVPTTFASRPVYLCLFVIFVVLLMFVYLCLFVVFHPTRRLLPPHESSSHALWAGSRTRGIVKLLHPKKGIVTSIARPGCSMSGRWTQSMHTEEVCRGLGPIISM